MKGFWALGFVTAFALAGSAVGPGEEGEGGEVGEALGSLVSGDVVTAELELPAASSQRFRTGTLTWPTKGCPCPAAVLLPALGSHTEKGRTQGQEGLPGRGLLVDLAQQLAAQGIASLRLGGAATSRVAEGAAGSAAGGGPGGAWTGSGQATAQGTAQDLLRWIPFLKGHPAVRGERVGMVAVRGGGLVASLAAARSPEMAFLILLDPPDLPGIPASLLHGLRTPTLAVLGGGEAQSPEAGVWRDGDHDSPGGMEMRLESGLDLTSGRDRMVVVDEWSRFMDGAGPGVFDERPEPQEGKAPHFLDLLTLWIRTHTGPREVGSCTVVHAAHGEISLGAGNEDHDDPSTHFWVIPPGAGSHGWVKFGFSGGFPQAGMNDQGLFWDATGSPYLAMPHSEATKTLFDGPLMVKVMEEAASVGEAREIFGAYYCEDQYRAQYLLGDAWGQSIIVEGDEILEKEGRGQVLTNFYQSHPELGGYPCGRFATATQMLAEADEIAPFLMGSILDATHQNGKYPTQYSAIYDLKGLRIYLFYYHNFHEYLVLELEKEFQKGVRNYAIPPLFSQIRLQAPGYGAQVAGSSVQLRWEGSPTSAYQLCWGTSPEPGGSCQAIQPQVAGTGPEGGLLLAGASLLLLVLGYPPVGTLSRSPSRGRRKRRLFLLVFFLMAGGFGCDSDPTGPEADVPEVVEMLHTLHGLESGTTYYWKVKGTAPIGSGFTTETITYRFTTGG